MSHTGRTVVDRVRRPVVIVASAVYFFVRAIRRPFDDQLDGRGVGPLEHRHLVVLGRIGWIGRGRDDGAHRLLPDAEPRGVPTPSEASGLDGALRQFVDNDYRNGSWSFVVAIGLIVYGVYCVISAPRERLAPADD